MLLAATMVWTISVREFGSVQWDGYENSSLFKVSKGRWLIRSSLNCVGRINFKDCKVHTPTLNVIFHYLMHCVEWKVHRSKREIIVEPIKRKIWKWMCLSSFLCTWNTSQHDTSTFNVKSQIFKLSIISP